MQVKRMYCRKMVLMKLTKEQAERWEVEMRTIEKDPTMTKEAMRVFMQLPMECGHAVGNLLTCNDPPFGCAICIEKEETQQKLEQLKKDCKRVPVFGTRDHEEDFT